MERVSPAILEELLRRMTDYELADFKVKCQQNEISLDKFTDRRLLPENDEGTLASAVPDAHYIEQLSKPELVDLIQHRLTDEQVNKMLDKLSPKDAEKLFQKLPAQQVADMLKKLDDSHLESVFEQNGQTVCEVLEKLPT